MSETDLLSSLVKGQVEMSRDLATVREAVARTDERSLALLRGMQALRDRHSTLVASVDHRLSAVSDREVEVNRRLSEVAHHLKGTLVQVGQNREEIGALRTSSSGQADRLTKLEVKADGRKGPELSELVLPLLLLLGVAVYALLGGDVSSLLKR